MSTQDAKNILSILKQAASSEPEATFVCNNGDTLLVAELVNVIEGLISANENTKKSEFEELMNTSFASMSSKFKLLITENEMSAASNLQKDSEIEAQAKIIETMKAKEKELSNQLETVKGQYDRAVNAFVATGQKLSKYQDKIITAKETLTKLFGNMDLDE